MSKNILSLALLVATVVTPLASARAADLDPGYAEIPALQEAKVEFGSGWYIRGDLAATKTLHATSSNPTFNTTDPASIPTAPTLSFDSSSDLGYTASLGAGYQFNRWFRADAIFDFHQPVASNYSGTPSTCPGAYLLQSDGTYKLGQEGCVPHYGANLQTYDVLFNGYIDLGTWYHVTPYVGAGVGLAFGHYSASSKYFQTDGTSYNNVITYPPSGQTFHEDFDSSKSGTYYNVAFALMAGVAIDVADHTKLDVGYRYLNLGKVGGSSTSLYEQEVRAGLRYMIDD